jgi:hypothetical protein
VLRHAQEHLVSKKVFIGMAAANYTRIKYGTANKTGEKALVSELEKAKNIQQGNEPHEMLIDVNIQR